MSDVGVVYLARGVDPNWRERITRFIASYMKQPAGVDHKLYVIYKEFGFQFDFMWATEQFAPLSVVNIGNYVTFNSL